MLNVAPEIDIKCQVLRVEGSRVVGKTAEKGPLSIMHSGSLQLIGMLRELGILELTFQINQKQQQQNPIIYRPSKLFKNTVLFFFPIFL